MESNQTMLTEEKLTLSPKQIVYSFKPASDPQVEILTG
jgi:hypothetical protein